MGVFPYYGYIHKNAQKSSIKGLLMRYRAFLGEPSKQPFDLQKYKQQHESHERYKSYP
jgi:hypothetical protein